MKLRNEREANMLLHRSATPEPYCWDDETEFPRERRIIRGSGIVIAVLLVAAAAAIAIFIRWFA